MKKNLIIGAAITLLIASGVGTFAIIKNNSGDDSLPSNSTTQKSSGNPTFAPVATAGSSYEATYSSTVKDGTTSTGLISVDKNGNSKYSGTAEGKAYALYSIDGDTISCTDNTCYKLPAGQATDAISSSDYDYTDADYANYQNNATYKGTAGCPAGTCSVWEIVDKTNSTTTTMYIDNSNRISKVMGESNDGKYEVSYDYKSVTVSPPANVTELPSYQ